MDRWMSEWIKTWPEIRKSDIINVNKGLPNPYVHDIPKIYHNTSYPFKCMSFSRLLLWSVKATIQSNFENISYLISECFLSYIRKQPQCFIIL